MPNPQSPDKKYDHPAPNVNENEDFEIIEGLKRLRKEKILIILNK